MAWGQKADSATAAVTILCCNASYKTPHKTRLSVHVYTVQKALKDSPDRLEALSEGWPLRGLTAMLAMLQLLQRCAAVLTQASESIALGAGLIIWDRDSGRLCYAPRLLRVLCADVAKMPSPLQEAQLLVRS